MELIIRAISDRCFLERLEARAFPPMRPRATAAAFLPSGSAVGPESSGSWPVAMRITLTALPITSAGRRSPLGPLAIILVLHDEGLDLLLKVHCRITVVHENGLFQQRCAVYLG